MECCKGKHSSIFNPTHHSTFKSRLLSPSQSFIFSPSSPPPPIHYSPPIFLQQQGGEEQGGLMRYVPSKMVSKLDLPGQKKLKLRADGRGNAADVAAKDLKAALAEKEHAHFMKNGGVALEEEDFEEQKQADLRILDQLSNIPGTSCGGDLNGQKERLTLIPNAADADLEDSDDEDDSDSDDSDSEDKEEAELLAELERIKKERAEEEAKRAAQEAAEVEEVERAELMGGNPLLAGKLAAAAAAAGGSGDGGAGGASFALKRRWDEDVVFRNQARGEPKQQRRFINDTIRSDFHRRFLDKYLK